MKAFLTRVRQNLNSLDFVFQVATDVEPNFPRLLLFVLLPRSGYLDLFPFIDRITSLLFNSLSPLYSQDISPVGDE